MDEPTYDNNNSALDSLSTQTSYLNSQDLSSTSLDSQSDSKFHPILNFQQSHASDLLDGIGSTSSNGAIVPTLPAIVEAQQLCSEIREISNKLWESRKAGDEHWVLDLATRRQLDLKFIKLRQLNRKMCQDKQNIKNKTHYAKGQMDLAHMKLQDVMFQKCLLKSTLSKFPRRFKFEDISLITLDEFMKTAPERYLPVMPEDTDTKQRDHQLLLAQLRYELAERTRLNDNYLEKLKRKEDVLRRLRGKSKLYHEVNKIMSDPFSTIKSLQQINSTLVASISSSPETKFSIDHSSSMVDDN
ncbi:2951_t:CDS:2 [Dentiscutata heterogama]|uniref:2951_t:CDS:1 n=1 Tax=Dentiscutata heterogama TaxID=1316150 RepID=A0ACA9KFS7_9GLOM|nr:2951_t:CDS:2 [Dentiscutata heterogama]